MHALAFKSQILALINLSVNPRALTGDTFVSQMVTRRGRFDGNASVPDGVWTEPEILSAARL